MGEKKEDEDFCTSKNVGSSTSLGVEAGKYSPLSFNVRGKCGVRLKIVNRKVIPPANRPEQTPRTVGYDTDDISSTNGAAPRTVGYDTADIMTRVRGKKFEV